MFWFYRKQNSKLYIFDTKNYEILEYVQLLNVSLKPLTKICLKINSKKSKVLLYQFMN